VMVTWDGQTKLLDFGIAKAANSLSRTKVGTVKGTAGYMSPEQVRGEPVDGRADVFSLGVVAWEMVTGRRLFSADTELAEMQLILSGPVERPDVVEPVVPAPLADVVMRALAREPADRFPTARDFSKALGASCSDLSFDQEQRGAFMRELFSDRIEQTRKLFELSKSKKQGATIEGEARRLVKSLQESAMSQPVLKPIPGQPRVHAGKRKTKVRQRSAEDEKLFELALKVEQVSAGEALHAPPRRTWGGVVLLVVGVLLAVGVARRVFLPEKRVSSSGLTLWDGESDDGAVEQERLPGERGVRPTGPVDTAAIPGLDRPARPPADEAPGGSEPLTVPAPVELEPPGSDAPLAPVAEPRRVPRVAAAAATGEVTLALLPEATVFLGKEELARGSFVSFKLPPGTHLLTILGSDGVKRRLSLPVANGKNPARRFKLDDLPAQ
ncbi:MAG: serine/threonine protein kinase, partial [Myxococcaceae bacterium]|nr:serine/threonine protein kinase [Myxococcaceae bacterium]